MKKKYGRLVMALGIAVAMCFGTAMTACNAKGNKTQEPAETEQQIDEDIQNEAAGESNNRIEQAMEHDPAQPAGSTVMSSDIIPANGKPTLIDFSASWCGPCRQMAPIFEELEDTYDDHINFVKIDVDEYSSLAADYGIQAVPTFVFLDKSGKEISRIEGAVGQAPIENAINKVIAGK